VTTIYAVNDQGMVFSWTPGNAPTFKTKRPTTYGYRDIHGASSSQLFIAAVDPFGDNANIHAYNASTNSLDYLPQFSGIPSANNKSVLGVWAWDSSHAYAVGRAGLLVSWTGTGTNAWSFISPDNNMKQDLNGVVALDASSTYIASQDGKIRRPTASGWVEHFTATGPLKDIAASSREDIWAVGDGIVVHFPEP
jgi:hypothetical protein